MIKDATVDDLIKELHECTNKHEVSRVAVIDLTEQEQVQKVEHRETVYALNRALDKLRSTRVDMVAARASLEEKAKENETERRKAEGSWTDRVGWMSTVGGIISVRKEDAEIRTADHRCMDMAIKENRQTGESRLPQKGVKEVKKEGCL